MIEKTKWKWKKFEKQKPNKFGIYCVITDHEVERAWDKYEDIYKNQRLPNSPRSHEKLIKWARWSYNEVLYSCEEEFITYEKVWCFMDDKGQKIHDVVYWIELPLFPKDLI